LTSTIAERCIASASGSFRFVDFRLGLNPRPETLDEFRYEASRPPIRSSNPQTGQAAAYQIRTTAIIELAPIRPLANDETNGRFNQRRTELEPWESNRDILSNAQAFASNHPPLAIAARDCLELRDRRLVLVIGSGMIALKRRSSARQSVRSSTRSMIPTRNPTLMLGTTRWNFSPAEQRSIIWVRWLRCHSMASLARIPESASSLSLKHALLNPQRSPIQARRHHSRQRWRFSTTRKATKFSTSNLANVPSQNDKT